MKALAASEMEAATLRMALRSLAHATKASVLTTTGLLAVEIDSARREGPDDPREIDDALEALALRSREMARQNVSNAQRGG
jgi:hypothetical protein